MRPTRHQLPIRTIFHDFDLCKREGIPTPNDFAAHEDRIPFLGSAHVVDVYVYRNPGIRHAGAGKSHATRPVHQGSGYRAVERAFGIEVNRLEGKGGEDGTMGSADKHEV